MKLSDFNSKPNDGKILRYLIERVIGVRFDPPPGSEYYKLISLNSFHVSTHINDKHSKHNKKKFT